MNIAYIFNKYILSLEKFGIRFLKLKNKFPPLFIVGCPRSGTTIIYQYLMNSFNFSYFPNITRNYYNACVLSSLIGKLLFKYTPVFESKHGISEGALAPNDGWEVFHRWFPKYDHSQPVKTNRLYELKSIVRLLEIVFQAPFINKNNNNCARVKSLSDLFPDALFIFISRDTKSTVQSILKARTENHILPNEWWGAAPLQFYNQCFSTELEQAVYQVQGIRDHLKQSAIQISKENQLWMSYEEFCLEPEKLKKWVFEKYKKSGVMLKGRNTQPPKSFNVKTTHHFDTPDLDEQFNDALKKYAGC